MLVGPAWRAASQGDGGGQAWPWSLECPAHGKAAPASPGVEGAGPPLPMVISRAALGMCWAAILQRNLLFFTQEKLKAAQLATSMLQVHGRVRSCQAGRVLLQLLRPFPSRHSLPTLLWAEFCAVSLPLLHLQVTKASGLRGANCACPEELIMQTESQMQGGREKCSREVICTGNQSLLAEQEGQKREG